MLRDVPPSDRMRETKLIQEAGLQQHIRSHVDQIADTLQFGSPTAIYQQMFSPSMKRRKYGFILISIVLIMGFPSAELIGTLLSTSKQPALILMTTIFFVPFCIFTLILAPILFLRATIPWYVFLYSEGFISSKGRRIDANSAGTK